MITRLLVANRGEIARRIMSTCREMDIDTVAVYSEADMDATFVHEADFAVHIGAAPPVDSYLRAGRILDAAALAGADAIHPGYGFLSENADFARAVEAAGLIWVGPPPEAIEAMGLKVVAKELMAAAGVPLLPSVELAGLHADQMVSAANDVGYPLLIKASAGGGGRGMRRVDDAEEFGPAVDAATREAESAFGDGTVFAERFVSPSKHVEVQIFGDHSGKVVHFGERECSVQRRYQKVIEEAPSPSIDDATRTALHAAAVSAGEAIGYTNAGTVEFLLDPSGGFYFLEVNTRLQVEHPVTETVHGVDLVKLQLEVAAGALVPDQTDIAQPKGHAIEARIYAEDPCSDYLPSVGTVTHFEVGPGVRVDAAFDSAGNVSAHYDAMIAKVISHAPTRPQAVRGLARALRSTALVGIDHNIALLVRTLEHDDFVSGGDTDLLDRAGPEVLGRPLIEGAALAAALLAGALGAQAVRRSTDTVTPSVTSGFRNVATSPQVTAFNVGGDEYVVTYRLERGRLVHAAINGEAIDEVALIAAEADRVDLVVGAIRQTHDLTHIDDTVVVSSASGVVVATASPRFDEPTQAATEGSLVASMPGTIRSVNVAVGDSVVAGQTILVMEAMKMEMSIAANADGEVREVHVQEGDTVVSGSILVVIERRERLSLDQGSEEGR